MQGHFNYTEKGDAAHCCEELWTAENVYSSLSAVSIYIKTIFENSWRYCFALMGQASYLKLASAKSRAAIERLGL